MKAILNIFAPVTPGEHPIAVMKQPADFSYGELHTICIALERFQAENPGFPGARSAGFKMNVVRASWDAQRREQQ